MEITQEEYNRISNIQDNDDAFEETLKLLEPYFEKYKEYYKSKNFEELNEENFKNETKIIFGLLHYVFSTINTDDSDEEDDREKFKVLSYYTNYVYNKIDEMKFNEQNLELEASLSYIFDYFEEQLEDNTDLNNDVLDKIKEINNIITENDNISEINNIITENDNITKNNVITREEFLEYQNWCKNTLKNSDKEEVMIIIEEFHSLEKKDYKSLYDEENDKDIQEKYIRYMQIDNLLNIILRIENKLKK